MLLTYLKQCDKHLWKSRDQLKPWSNVVEVMIILLLTVTVKVGNILILHSTTNLHLIFPYKITAQSNIEDMTKLEKKGKLI